MKNDVKMEKDQIHKAKKWTIKLVHYSIKGQMITSKQVPMSKPYNLESKVEIEPSYSTAELTLLLGTSVSEFEFNLEWSIYNKREKKPSALTSKQNELLP